VGGRTGADSLFLSLLVGSVRALPSGGHPVLPVWYPFVQDVIFGLLFVLLLSVFGYLDLLSGVPPVGKG